MDRIKNRNSNLLCRTVFLKRTGKETLEKQVRPRKCKPFNVLLLDPLLLLSDHTDYFLSKPPCVRTSKLLDCENLLHSVWKLQKMPHLNVVYETYGVIFKHCAFLEQNTGNLRFFITAITALYYVHWKEQSDGCGSVLRAKLIPFLSGTEVQNSCSSWLLLDVGEWVD